MKPVLTRRRYLLDFPIKKFFKIFYLIKIHGQLININEVTDFDGGLYFSALRSNIISTSALDGLLYCTELMNIYICVKNI